MKLGPNQQKWVDALRSGKYEQGFSGLYTSGSRYCCLGVACVESGITGDDLAGGTLSCYPKVREWLSITTDVGYVEENNLAEINDSGTSFEKIANIIEKNSDCLFSESK
jgi:hypothetical protein